MLHVEEIRPFRVPDTPHNRLVTIAIVVGIHIAVISAFLMGLRPPIFEKEKGPLVVDFISDSHPKPAPTNPPPIQMRDPTLPDAPMPLVHIDEPSDPGPIIVVPPKPVGPVGPAIRDFGPRAIAGTHTIPDYPPIDTRLGHEGSVMLRLAIDERGDVVDAVVERSSGYGSLDKAAADWVKAHWRYYPATHGGDAVASMAEVTVTFHLSGHN